MVTSGIDGWRVSAKRHYAVWLFGDRLGHREDSFPADESIGGAMTMHITDETVRTDHGTRADAGRSVRSLRRNFPAWVCWYGAATRRWWGMPPPAYRHPALIEAATAEELALRIRHLPTAGTRRTQGHADAGRSRRHKYPPTPHERNEKR
jgi:hypothetical protein